MKTLAFHLSNTKRAITNISCYEPSMKNTIFCSLYSLRVETFKMHEKVLCQKWLLSKVWVLCHMKVILASWHLS